MNPSDLTGLPWLPPPAADFGAACKALRRAAGPDPAAVRRLATASLDLQQLTALARCLPASVAGMPAGAWRLAVLSNATTDLLLPAVAATGPRHGVWLELRAPAFGTHAQEAMDPGSATRQWQPDAVWLAIDNHGVDLRPCPGQAEQAQQRVDAACDELQAMARALQGERGCLVVLQTLVPPQSAVFGQLERQLAGTHRWMVDAFNRQLRGARPPGTVLLDAEQIASDVGLSRWHDPVLWHLGKFPFSQAVTPLVAEHLCRLLMAAQGRAKKCLVLDLDNTLWGGVIGDDGLDGIVLGQGSAVGEAHLQVQATALALHDRGIVLAVSSKNEDSVARQVFRQHPDMLLREQHIAAFQANWQDKASNLVAIAKALNIGVDALVLLDDNPAERQQVRMALPEVGVPELPEGPEYFADMLLAAGYFETLQFTAEDADRAGQYQANAARSTLLESGNDLQAHLAALQMQAEIAPFDDRGRARITQLINKTNQFNLTSRRRTEAEVAALQHDPSALTLQVRLKDRFGDNGMISVVIGQVTGQTMNIDTWLMSCRVLNRGVERAVLNLLVGLARQRGCLRLVGEYLATAKNAMVSGHYAGLGFSADPQAGEASRWVLELAGQIDQVTAIWVEASAFEPVAVSQ